MLPDKAITRPTMNHVRESVFNILEHRLLLNGLKDVKCLDAFAGSGSLGLEALSRGASTCIFVENNKKAFSVLCKNFMSVAKKESQGNCINKNVLDYEQSICFDLVFLDPPFKNNEFYYEILSQLKEKKMIDKHTIIYVESQENGPVFRKENILDERYYGSIKIQFIQAI